MVDTGSLIDKLYQLDVQTLIDNESLYVCNVGTRQKLTNKNLSMLWHKCLGHISKQCIQWLVLQGILESLDISDFDICIQCI